MADPNEIEIQNEMNRIYKHIDAILKKIAEADPGRAETVETTPETDG